MFEVHIGTHMAVSRGDGSQLTPQLLELLIGVHESGSIAQAAARAGLSYRYAWGLLRDGQRLFGTPLVRSSRGRGARLSALGERLVWADRRVAARLSPLLESLATEIEAELERAISSERSILRMQASHGFGVETLRHFLAREQIPLDLKYRSTREGLGALVAGGCELAGFNVPIGALENAALENYRPWLLPERHRVAHLATRRQGLIVERGNPLRIGALPDLCREGVRFVNRQPGSSTRMLFDLLLARATLAPVDIAGYDSYEYTHPAVAAYVASGMAHAGFGLETPARRFGLDFVPMVTERYFLLGDASVLESAVMRGVLAIMRGDAFRQAVNALPGYDASLCGTVQTLPQAFAAIVG